MFISFISGIFVVFLFIDVVFAASKADSVEKCDTAKNETDLSEKTVDSTVNGNPFEGSPSKEIVLRKFGDIKPNARSENNLKGIVTKFKPDGREIALTFDACRGDIDWELINYLKDNDIPATFFWTSKWIEENPEAAEKIASYDLFDIQNHGFEHRPCFVDGGRIYGIHAPQGGPAGVFDEIQTGNDAIAKITGKKTKFYRSGTAYYDDACIKIANELGYDIAGFSVLGDGGATYTKSQVKKALLSAKSGDIVIMHMNHPEKETAEGVMEAIPVLKKRGFKFVLLKDKPCISCHGNGKFCSAKQ